MSQYAQNSDFIVRYDVRTVADLLSDTGAPVAAASVATNSVLSSLLQDASADIDAACFRGNRYTPAQLIDLTGTSAQLLIRLCCDMGLLYLKRRRGRYKADVDGELAKSVDDRLKALANGENYLMLADQDEAAASTEQLDQTKMFRKQPMRTVFNFVQNYFPIQVKTGQRWSGYR